MPLPHTVVAGVFTGTCVNPVNWCRPNDTERANAQALYATLTARISAFNSNRDTWGGWKYAVNGSRHFETREHQWPLCAGFMANQAKTDAYLRIRWQPQKPVQRC